MIYFMLKEKPLDMRRIYGARLMTESEEAEFIWCHFRDKDIEEEIDDDCWPTIEEIINR